MTDLKILREQINEIDLRLLKVIAERLTVVEEIGQWKKQNHQPVRDPLREQERLNELKKFANELGIGDEVVEQVWKTLFKISYNIEK